MMTLAIIIMMAVFTSNDVNDGDDDSNVCLDVI